MAIRRRTGAYWEKRSIERLAEAERESLPHLRRIVRIYEEAARKTVRSVRDMYAAYYREQGWDLAKLNSIAPSGDIKRFLNDMRSAGLETELPNNYRGRMTRLELLNAQIWGEVKKVAQKHHAIETDAHVRTINNSYNRTIYDTARGFGRTPEFTRLNTVTVDRVLNTKFQGKNYSARIWKNTDLLASQLKDVLGAAIATGQSPEKTVREIRQRFQVGSFQARRLVQTETNFFENVAEIEAYEEMGIGSFVFVATLDGRTSQICREHDGKRYPVSKAKPGVNMPPLHPYCRSTIRPYIGKEYEPEVRIARDGRGRNIYVTNMTYEQWAKSIGGLTIIPASSIPPLVPPGTAILRDAVPDGLSQYRPELHRAYDEIQPLPAPENLFVKIMESNPTNPYGTRLTVAELDLAGRLKELGYKFDILSPRESKRGHLATPDIRIFSRNWELKTITATGRRTIRNDIWHATDAGKRFIMLDITYMNVPTTQAIRDVLKHLSIKKNDELIRGLIVVRGKKIIRIK